MALVQVASSARTKQEHLEAGRKRLEAFRKKKKEEAKKAAAAAKLSRADGVPLESHQSNLLGSDNTTDESSSNNGVAVPFAENDNELIPNDEHHFSISWPKSAQAEQPPASKGLNDSEFRAGRHGDNSIDKRNNLKTTNGDREAIFAGTPAGPVVTESDKFHQNAIWSSPVAAERHIHDFGEKSSADFANTGVNRPLGTNHRGSDVNHALTAKPVLLFPTFDYESTLNHSYPDAMTSESRSHRSRPSFLDSILSERLTSTSHTSIVESEKARPLGLMKRSSEDVALVQSSSPYPATVQPFVDPRNLNPQSSPDHHVSDNSQSPGCGSLDTKLEAPSGFYEDFKALEQHIEDLTQEKFSLQRSLDASKTLAESLAAENSSITDCFNQQGEVVSQLKSDLEKLQEQIVAQLSFLEAMRMEYTHVQLECSAADERAKILASEVIGLEEKSLRLRSNELKLEKQLESATAEISLYKKKISNLEKELKSMQSMIDALQEEKKFLQSKLRKATFNGKSVDTKRSISTKDVSTSTDDSGSEVMNDAIGEASAIGMVTDDRQGKAVESFPLPPDRLYTGLPSTYENEFHLSTSFTTLPSDQLRIVDNIRSLIVELTIEKEELLHDLVRESSQASELKELNKELSQKLETQTQRLELLTAQNMAYDTSTRRPSDSYSTQNVPAYADEGDEVVERVLGWIMKLFPGGSTKRRTSKLL